MSVESKRSSRIQFGVLFDTALVDVKDDAKLQFMTEIHDKLSNNEPVSDGHLYDYCVCLWSFVDFLRANPKLATTAPLEFVCRGQACNCYWWEVLTTTERYADCVATATQSIRSGAECKQKLEAFRSCRNALGLLYKLRTEALPLWTDRGSAAAFASEVNKRSEACDQLYKLIRCRALLIGAQVIENDVNQSHSVAQMHAAIYELSDKKDTSALAASLLAESRYMHHTGEYGMAISLAQTYERVQSDITHPDLNIWRKSNQTTWHAIVPAVLEPNQALVTPSKQYEKGAAPAKLVLFALKKKT